VLVAVRREGEHGAGQNRMFAWCAKHQVAYPVKGNCPRCYPTVEEIRELGEVKG
jgi:hypothetical protein